MTNGLQVGYNAMLKPKYRMTITATLAAAMAVASLSPAFAGGAGSSGGLTLIEAAGARAAALGEAVSAAADDVTAAVYNPAALSTLTSPQVSFSYLKGIAGDASGRLHLGQKNLGLSVSYYSAGSVDIIDGGSPRTVNAETDLAATLGGAFTRGRIGFGGAVKFLSSQLAESSRATAYAVDLGVRSEISPRFRVSSALQNLGTKLKFVDEGDPLPRILRAGAEFEAIHGRAPITLSVETPYFLNEKELRPSLGAEIRVGPMAFRAGYRMGSAIEGLSLGAGFSAGGLLIDYAFGFVQDLNNRQRISVGFKFGGANSSREVHAPMIQTASTDVSGEPIELRSPIALFNGGQK